MDMTLSKRGDYVMRSAIALARAYDEGVARKIREVVAETEVPGTFASQILADLVRAELAVSKAGRDGGYRLSRPPAQISVLEVVEAAEGPLRAERCALGEGPCRWDGVCPLHETWTQATATLRELLSATSLAELAERDAAIEADAYPVPPDAHRSHPLATEVTDRVQVEVGLRSLQVALAATTGRLGQLAADATVEVRGTPEGTDPKPGGPAPVAEVSLAPVEADGEGSERYLLAWRLTLPGISSRLEAELVAAPVDAERSELRVEGTWRQSADREALLERAGLERQARAILRSFLRRLARLLEEPVGGTTAQAKAAKRPSGAGAARRSAPAASGAQRKR